MLMLTIFLILARIYYQGNDVTATVVIMIIIFSIAYLYIIGESVYLGIKEKNLFQINRFKTDIKLIIKQYIKCTCLVSLFGFIVRFIMPEFYDKNIELMMHIRTGGLFPRLKTPNKRTVQIQMNCSHESLIYF